jgi:hypothetical protein
MVKKAIDDRMIFDKEAQKCWLQIECHRKLIDTKNDFSFSEIFFSHAIRKSKVSDSFEKGF